MISNTRYGPCHLSVNLRERLTIALGENWYTRSPNLIQSIPLGDLIAWSIGIANSSFLRICLWISVNWPDRFSTYLVQLWDFWMFWVGKHTSRGNQGFLPNIPKYGDTPVTRFLALFNSNKIVFSLSGQEPGLVESSEWRDAPSVRWLLSTLFPWGEYVWVWVVLIPNCFRESWNYFKSNQIKSFIRPQVDTYS